MATLDHISELMSASLATTEQRSLAPTVPVSVHVDDLANQVGKLSLASEGSQLSRRAPEIRSSRDNVLVECAQFCAVLVKATVCLESEGAHASTVMRTSLIFVFLHRF